MRKLIIGLGVVIGVIVILIYATGNSYLFPALFHNYANIDDYKVFDNSIIKKSTRPQAWPISDNYNKKALSPEFLQKLKAKETVAFLVIRNDSIQYEEYWDGYSQNSHSNSFSIAKSYVSALTGIALKQGKIKSIDQPVSDFITEWKSDDRRFITIKHLLTMSSGLNWSEAYSDLFSITTKAYYGDDLKKLCLNLKSIDKPGKKFEYRSGDTQILSFVLAKATGTSLSGYLEKNIWQNLGCENDAFWSLDKENGVEKAYCCLNSNTRDFAKLGQLYLQMGNWKGQQIIDSAYIKASITPTGLFDPEFNKKTDVYGYTWWLIPDYKGHKIFYARGILGQYMIMIPDKKIIAVRLGEIRGEHKGEHYDDVFEILDEVLSNY